MRDRTKVSLPVRVPESHPELGRGPSRRQARKPTAERAFLGMAGSPLAKGSECSRQFPPKSSREQLVLVHFCFDQQEGEQKPARCNCKQRVSKARAYELIEAGQADFLLVPNPKTNSLTKFHRSIVARRVVVLGEPLLPPARRDAWAERRDTKHLQNKTEILNKARAILQTALSKRTIAQVDLYVTDTDLELAFEDEMKCSKFLSKFSSHKKLFIEMADVVLLWWENILGYSRLSMGAGRFLEGAPHSSGEMLTGFGGKDQKADEIAAIADAAENDIGHVSAANFVKRPFNGGVISSVGDGPASYDETNFSETDYCPQE
jgi:hypothetical protein